MPSQKDFSTSRYSRAPQLQSTSVGTTKVENLITPITVEECNSSATGVRSLISFGDSKVKKVCGEGNSDFTEKERLSKFLNEVWSNSSSGSKLNSSKGTNHCFIKDLDSNEVSEEYKTLGKGSNENCNGDEYVELTKERGSHFIKKQKKVGGGYTLFICGRNCWKGNTFNVSGTAHSQVVQENSSNGSELKFGNSSYQSSSVFKN